MEVILRRYPLLSDPGLDLLHYGEESLNIRLGRFLLSARDSRFDDPSRLALIGVKSAATEAYVSLYSALKMMGGRRENGAVPLSLGDEGSDDSSPILGGYFSELLSNSTRGEVQGCLSRLERAVFLN